MQHFNKQTLIPGIFVQKKPELHVHPRLCHVTFWFCFCFCNFLLIYSCMSLYFFFHIHPISLCFSFILYGLLNSMFQYSFLIRVNYRYRYHWHKRRRRLATWFGTDWNTVGGGGPVPKYLCT